MSNPDRLAAMANQIAAFFKTQPGDAAANIADHLMKFWTASMCAALVAHVEAGGAIDPTAKRAVEMLKTTAN